MTVGLLEDMSVYRIHTGIADEIYKIVYQWNFFDRDTVGMQLVRAFDSIGANIAEGYGRYHFGDKIKFYYYARGSAFESQYWIKRGRARGLITDNEGHKFLLILQQILKELNALIKHCKTFKNTTS
jgi:four helix bundle protein